MIQSTQTVIEVGADGAALAERVRARLVGESRFLLGICGAPGSGKSTIAARLVATLGEDAVAVPMDGFHIATAGLASPQQLARRGAIDTFDAGGFLALLRRVRERTEDVVYAPGFDRRIGDPIAGLLPVRRAARIVITEGNYLLSQEPQWRDIAGLLDETWFLELDQETRVSRLVARHRQFGKSAQAAEAMAHGSDETNARLVAQARDRADLLIRLVGA